MAQIEVSTKAGVGAEWCWHAASAARRRPPSRDNLLVLKSAVLLRPTRLEVRTLVQNGGEQNAQVKTLQSEKAF